MCSLDYLSKKSILTDRLRKTQLTLLKLKSEYQVLLKNDKIETVTNVMSYEEVKLRNTRILQDLKDQNELMNRTFNTDYSCLRDLKEKYVLNIKESSKSPHHTTKPTQISHPIVEKYDYPDNTCDIKTMNETLLSPRITPRLRDSRERMVSPIPSIMIHKDEYLDVLDISDQNKETFSVFQAKNEVLENNDDKEIVARNNLIKLEIGNKKEDSEERVITPVITPRYSDKRERMCSPSPPKLKNNLMTSCDSLESDEEYVNDVRYGGDGDKEELSFQHFLRLFDIIYLKFDMKTQNNRRDYIEGSKTMECLNKVKEKTIKNILSENTISNLSHDEVSVKDLVSFMLNWLPKICVKIEFDMSNLLEKGLEDLMLVRNKPSFDTLTSKMRKILCQTNDQEQMWNILVHHFQRLVQEEFLSNIEVAEIFSPLLMPISSTDSNEEKIIELLSTWLSFIDDKNKQLTQCSISGTFIESSMLTDEDADTSSSDTSSSLNEPEKPTVPLERSYSELRKSLNTASKIVSFDDDPNDDINTLFARPTKKVITDTPSQVNITKQRLAQSIRNIDDDILLDDVPIPKKNLTNNDSDDEFDFQ